MDIKKSSLKNIFFGVYTRAKRILTYNFYKTFSKKWNNKSLKVKLIGNRYGGGYIIPGLLNKDSIVYSFGIGEDVSFDLEIINNFNCKIFGFDPTPKSIDWVMSQKLPSNFSFLPFGLAKKTGKQTFFLPKVATEVSASMTSDLGGGKIECDFLTFEDTLKKTGHTYIDLLKIDIEGEEYNLFQDWVDRNYHPPVGQIWVEFHPKRAGYSNYETARFINKLKSISLVPAKNVVIHRTNHYLLVNSKLL